MIGVHFLRNYNFTSSFYNYLYIIVKIRNKHKTNN